MKHYPHIVAKVLREPWLITQDKHDTILSVLAARLAGKSSDTVITIGDEKDEEIPEPIKEGGTLIIPVHGIIGKHLTSLEMECGGCDLDLIADAIDSAMDDESINLVALDFRSPGGTVTGVPEVADKIAELAELKDVIAFTDSEMGSAAYWMASQANMIAATRSAMVGSIGVRLAFLDQSRMMAAMGVDMHSFQAGDFKTMGAWWRPPTDDERKMFQASVDKIYRAFTDAVTIKRVVDESVMQGQCFDGDECISNGLIDALVADLDEAIDMTRE